LKISRFALKLYFYHISIPKFDKWERNFSKTREWEKVVGSPYFDN
jgi:hypothetical protein